MTGWLAAGGSVAWYALGLMVMRPLFRRALIRGTEYTLRRWPTLFHTAAEGRREWMSMDGSLLLVGCFLAAPIWPAILLVGWIARGFLRPVPAERAEHIEDLERELGMRR